MNVVPNNIQPSGPLNKALIDECKEALLNKKEEIFEQMNQLKADYQGRDRSGDEVDQSVEVLAENQMVSSIQRLTGLLVEIENALARIEQGVFGVCEETEEYIESDRLKALPWTRLSIEGAEIREALSKRYAK